MKTKNSLIYSVSYENYQNKILTDKENRTQGSWKISPEMVEEIKYAYVYLKNSEKMIVKKYEIEHFKKTLTLHFSLSEKSLTKIYKFNNV